MVEEINEKEFELLMKKPFAVVDFFAEWCMPCVMMEPVVDEVADKFKGKIDFGKVNVDENQKLAEKLGVLSIPTLIVFKKGEEIIRITGALPAEALEEKLKKFLK